jgi:hypothetical protein
MTRATRRAGSPARLPRPRSCSTWARSPRTSSRHRAFTPRSRPQPRSRSLSPCPTGGGRCQRSGPARGAGLFARTGHFRARRHRDASCPHPRTRVGERVQHERTLACDLPRSRATVRQLDAHFRKRARWGRLHHGALDRSPLSLPVGLTRRTDGRAPKGYEERRRPNRRTSARPRAPS